jgi:hypothetical protein
MSAAGAGENVKVQVPSPLSTAIGPAAGSHPQNGPVIRTEVAAEQTSVVIIKSVCAIELILHNNMTNSDLVKFFIVISFKFYIKLIQIIVKNTISIKSLMYLTN